MRTFYATIGLCFIALTSTAFSEVWTFERCGLQDELTHLEPRPAIYNGCVFGELFAYDFNNDGVIKRIDAEIETLRVWFRFDDTGEVITVLNGDEILEVFQFFVDNGPIFGDEQFEQILVRLPDSQLTPNFSVGFSNPPNSQICVLDAPCVSFYQLNVNNPFESILTSTTNTLDLVEAMDNDDDGSSDTFDNCILEFNPAQTDTDNDGLGNACDADFNNDCIVNMLDLALFAQAFFSIDAATNSQFDLNVDGLVNMEDLGVLRENFFQSPANLSNTNVCTSI